MKKSFILGIMVGGIIFGTSVYAISNYLYKADEVSYTPKDNTWNVSDVNEAINSLKLTSESALTNLKNTDIAKAVNANGDTFSSVIDKLDSIATRGNISKSINPGSSTSISSGYYSGGSVSCSSCNCPMAKAIYLGEYSSNTTIDVSSLNATSVDQFVAVSSTAKTHSAPTTSANGDVSNYYGMGWINSYGYYTPASMTLNGNTLSVVPAKIGASANSNHAAAGRSDSYLKTKVYYVGNVKSIN